MELLSLFAYTNRSLYKVFVSIPGFVTEFRNREGIRGGGVGVYVKENINYKRRSDIENRELKMETFSGRRRPDWQRKPGTKAAVASRQK